MIEQLRKISDENPNDMIFGAKIREFINKSNIGVDTKQPMIFDAFVLAKKEAAKSFFLPNHSPDTYDVCTDESGNIIINSDSSLTESKINFNIFCDIKKK